MALESEQLPEGAILASLGCGNPTAVADLHEGEIVLDLGSGGGIDVLLSAKRVGPTGKAYGLDMTEEMLALAIQTDVLGVPWIAYCLWWLAGSVVTACRERGAPTLGG